MRIAVMLSSDSALCRHPHWKTRNDWNNSVDLLRG
jgi:hypothetical protein